MSSGGQQSLRLFALSALGLITENHLVYPPLPRQSTRDVSPTPSTVNARLEVCVYNTTSIHLIWNLSTILNGKSPTICYA